MQMHNMTDRHVDPTPTHLAREVERVVPTNDQSCSIIRTGCLLLSHKVPHVNAAALMMQGCLPQLLVLQPADPTEAIRAQLWCSNLSRRRSIPQPSRTGMAEQQELCKPVSSAGRAGLRTHP